MAEVLSSIILGSLQIVDLIVNTTRLVVAVNDAPQDVRKAASILGRLKDVLERLKNQYSGPDMAKLNEVAGHLLRDLQKIHKLLPVEALNSIESDYAAADCTIPDKIKLSIKKRVVWATYGSKRFQDALVNLKLYMDAFNFIQNGDIQ